MSSSSPETKLGPNSPNMSAPDRAVIDAAIAEAERSTGAEFIVAIAARSGRYDRAEDLFGLIFGLIGVTAAWLVFQSVEAGAWDEHDAVTMTLGLPLVLAVFAIWTLLGAALATRVPALARPFITARQMEEEVRARAWEAYHIFRVDRAPNAAGVLIYVSLLERTVLIASGDGIGEKLPPQRLPPRPRRPHRRHQIQQARWTCALGCSESLRRRSRPNRSATRALQLHPQHRPPVGMNLLLYSDGSQYAEVTE